MTKRVTEVQLMLGSGELKSGTLAGNGVCDAEHVLVVFRRRSIECVQQQEAAYKLDVWGRYVILRIPDGTTEVPRRAFQRCCSVQELVLPSSVNRIEFAAFSHCKSLKRLTIPDSVTRIDHRAFQCCNSLTSVTISSGLTSIANFGFFFPEAGKPIHPRLCNEHWGWCILWMPLAHKAGHPEFCDRHRGSSFWILQFAQKPDHAQFNDEHSDGGFSILRLTQKPSNPGFGDSHPPKGAIPDFDAVLITWPRCAPSVSTMMRASVALVSTSTSLCGGPPGGPSSSW